MNKIFKRSKGKRIVSFFVIMAMIFSMTTQLAFATSNSENIVNTNMNTLTKEVNPSSDKSVNIIMFNDFHGNLAEDVRETGKNIGMAKMVGYAKDAVSKNPNTIIVSGGDNYQGTAMSNLTYGAPVSAMMKAMHVTASAVGNHEFDWGVSHMEKWQKDGGFNFLAANIYDSKTNAPVSWSKPYKIVEKGGIKVAFIGLAHPNTTTLTKRENVTGLEFRDPVKTSEEWIKYLKEGKAKEGIPDVIVALTHIDSYQDDNTKEITGKAVDLTKVKGLDAIVSAHSHRRVIGIINGKPIIQAYKYGRAIGIMSIKLDKDNKVTKIVPKIDDVCNTKSDIIQDEQSAETYNKYDKDLKPILGEKIGQATKEFTHDRASKGTVSLLGRWSCEVMQKKTGAQIAIQNGGGLRRTLYKGDITMGDMYEIMPFDNALVTFDFKGSDIKKAIDHGILNPEVTDGQFSGLKVEYDKNKEFEHRITKITLTDGTPLDMNKYYKLTVPDFLLSGGDKYDFSNAKNVVETFIPVRDVLVEAIKNAKVITPKAVDYIKECEVKPMPKPEVKPEVKPVQKPVPKPEVKPEVKPDPNVRAVYFVKGGDTLKYIARAYGVSWRELAKFNKLDNPNMIFPGQKILIPVQGSKENSNIKATYVVKRYDTLKKIGNIYGISWRRIAKFNKLNNPNMIFENQKILIPA
ncbi:5'-nucleotidase C-terminal domain-containing protein [Clostridium botulinum]|uniref:5'-nucleotidase n=1 Tax=Clostridium botulinum C/D str. DC5 TaxID=1443128 RepID=A0A0A0ID91_CLOBO|nr:5'-nucleotidase C-terminal domain-containing protein [Clostridium botulinum]KGM98498.1 5'-nucleotidase [Clostridium botulinum C/D str. DC5]KOC51841.1 5'-nucleotidase [Clostridium botulinum]KOC53599.1 5'-nucleotidase [Clostridium botulinum]MCD3234867.1 LysM peptidoglycan-binding domain-containing protein [Clostridium botulinum D/C]MCD3240766.1 LysM peptidoglycan-binding domain-containing protein [Clostridium botulinum D/C]